MEISFEKDYLRELYEQGKIQNKKYLFKPTVVKQYKNTIDKLRVASCIQDLFFFKSLNYEKLQGDKKGIDQLE